ncbi:flagella synthesis protein FlgN [Pleionea sp. CnH1-48]|uniref:flagella synthesis protein FlgN n=1 Tax=Pleionea sp. CnH1-48 TaxID=2954494 RepID=UPI002097879B|nr:flagellar protein FlgN [Pleionea sp. CnH1-48]MCO7226166.1 flagellar protein FlgN [Pleionea sp. CnH1-48]
MNDNVKTFLKTAIRHELNLAQTLYDLLAQEQKYLEKRHVEGLNQCNEEKVKILSEIDQSSQRRLKVLGLRSITPNHIQLFESQLTDHELQREWDSLKDCFSQCKVQNEINGKIIELSQNSVTRAMNLLRQSRSQNNATTYSAKGYVSKSGNHLNSTKA